MRSGQLESRDHEEEAPVLSPAVTELTDIGTPQISKSCLLFQIGCTLHSNYCAVSPPIWGEERVPGT